MNRAIATKIAKWPAENMKGPKLMPPNVEILIMLTK